MSKPRYPSPYDMSDITYIDTTKTKIEFVETKSDMETLYDEIQEINRKLDEIIHALKNNQSC